MHLSKELCRGASGNNGSGVHLLKKVRAAVVYLVKRGENGKVKVERHCLTVARQDG